MTDIVKDASLLFALSYFGKSPLTLDKLIKLAICIAITHLVMLVAGKVASYIDNINVQKTQVKIQKYYFNKLQSMTMEQISNTHTGYIHKLITNLSFYFFEMIWQFEISVIPLIIGGTSILIIVCKQSVLTGIICIFISAIAVYLKYKMIKNKQKYQKKVNEAESKYNATFVDFIQNIIAVRKLNISKFCNDKIMENSEEYLKVTKLNERKRSNANGVFTGLMDSLYLIVIVSTIIMVSNGEDGLPYLLFYLSAIGKLYSNLNSLVRLIDMTERFKTAKKQLDDYFKDSKEIKFILDKEKSCFVLIDLKTKKITHQDVGQMDMYVRMYDEIKKAPDDNPTIGIVLHLNKKYGIYFKIYSVFYFIHHRY